MGFLGQISTVRELAVTVLLPGFQARCKLPVMGIVQTFLNDEQKGVFTLKGVTLNGLEANNPATSMQLEALYVRKYECHAVAFQEQLPHDQTGLMPRTERIVVYTSHYAIEGDFHMGADTLIGDFVDSSRSMFLGVTNAVIFPLFRSQAAVLPQTALAYIYNKAVRMYHPV